MKFTSGFSYKLMGGKMILCNLKDYQGSTKWWTDEVVSLHIQPSA